MKKREKVKPICLNQGADNSPLGKEIRNAIRNHIPFQPSGTPQGIILCQAYGFAHPVGNGCFTCQVTCTGLGPFGTGWGFFNVLACPGEITWTSVT
jgi:hypothetical protein